MTSERPLADLFHVKARFSRSVNIVADYSDTHSVTDYILTPLSRTVIRRVGEGFRSGSRARAWSVTGPYGSGKSACALFLSRVIGNPVDAIAHGKLEESDHDLFSELVDGIPQLVQQGFLIVPVVGSRQPLAAAVLKGLLDVFHAGASQSSTVDFVRNLETLAFEAQRGMVPVAAVVETVHQAARLARSDRALGVLIILDELGKILEYASLNPTQGDIYLLQALAELAARSGDSPIGLLAILHQSFERYGARLGPIQQREWAKVQGRFEDIGFIESAGELLRLIGSAIESPTSVPSLSRIIEKESRQALELGLIPRELGHSQGVPILQRCAPLHPTVALLLGRLFRSRLAQNERSLFAFLTSGEPRGLQEFLRTEQWDGNGRLPYYRLDDLYDYIVAAMGSALYSQTQGRRWAEIEDALDRLPPAASQLEARLVKTIGLLGLLGDQRNTKASESILTYCLADGVLVSREDVHQAIKRLRGLGIVVYRKHKDAFGLWEGSDIDLEERLHKGLDQIDKSASLASLLQRRPPLKPFVAKRHLYETGTLRFFVPWVVDMGDLRAVADRPFADADGVIAYVFGDDSFTPEEMLCAVQATSADLPYPRKVLMYFAIPRNVAGIREELEEVMAWEWVAQNTPELEGDSTARKELAGRLLDAQARLSTLCDRTFDRVSGTVSSVWVQGGQVLPFARPSNVTAALSDACDAAFPSAPIVRNELVNRRLLSSSAAAARRTLVERMISAPSEPHLGISGYPPELSMYRSVLEWSGLHHRGNEGWQFGLAEDGDPGRVAALWHGIDAFLSSTEHEKRSVADLFAMLQAPPYGIRLGLLPIYLAAAILGLEQEVALYETGSFIPKMDMASFERLMKSPWQFSIQRYRLGEARKHLFAQYSLLLGQAGPGVDGSTLLTAVRPLSTFARQLPPYTRLTQSLSPRAIAVREAILSAREPQPLLFDDLPQAVAMPPIGAETDVASAQAFFAELRKTLLELQNAYGRLLDSIQQQCITAFLLPAAADDARTEVSVRAKALSEHVADLRLKALALRLGDSTLRDREWLESVASCVANKPPKQWNDQDAVRFSVELADQAGRFRRVEDVAGHETGAIGRAVRLGVTLPTGEETREVVHISDEEEDELNGAVRVLRSHLRLYTRTKRLGVAIVAELARQVMRDTDTNPEKER